jgi:thiamine-phosphate pyrophosphorylase
MRGIHRILDANFNRAAEGMRVLEDIARFMLDRQDLCGGIKRCRHDLRSISRLDSMYFRDTAGDVGTVLETSEENLRRDVSDIAAAAGNRCAEALRVIEEVLKLENGANMVESIRYRMYEYSADVVLALGSNKRKQWRLCFILITARCELPWRETLKQAIDAGCDCVQVREKSMSTNKLIGHVQEVGSIASTAGVSVIVNDRVDVAMAAEANGVHLGDTDMTIRQARQICSNSLLIGATVHAQNGAARAIRQGADYLGIGPMFSSRTKPDTPVTGSSLLKSVLSDHPMTNHLAIGGITPTNARDLYAMGCRGVAMCDAIASSTTPWQVVRDTLAGAMQPS